MNADQAAALVRQLITFAGATFLSKWVDAGTVGQIAGAIGVLVSAGWSLSRHTDTSIVKAASALPAVTGMTVTSSALATAARQAGPNTRIDVR